MNEPPSLAGPALSRCIAVCEWIRTAINIAKTKATTYGALALTLLATLPELMPKYWDQVESLIPTSFPKESVHHALMAAGALAIILLRIRREVNAATSPEKVP